MECFDILRGHIEYIFQLMNTVVIRHELTDAFLYGLKVALVVYL